MSRAPEHRCRHCGASAQRWVGRCPGCGEWNSMEPFTGAAARCGPGAPLAVPVPLASVDPTAGRPRPTGIGEVDRVLGGGLLAGSVTLVFGEPGVGKSTLLLQVLTAAAASGRTTLLVSAEESAVQVRARALRLGPLPESLLVAATSDLVAAVDAVGSLGPDLVVVDSIQTVADPAVPGPPGSLAQVRACADRMTRRAKEQGTTVVLVGQVTKDGDLAGPRALEHLVDTVLAIEGDRHHSLRLLRAVKHRFGATGEVGLFELGDEGMVAVEDPGPMLLGDRRAEVGGSAVAPLLQGSRPLLVELQALACAGAPGGPRRNAQGIDPRRLAMVLAVLECRAGVALGPVELFVSAAGGIRAVEPAADLPLALALASAADDRPLPADLVSFGEIGLAGEVRSVPGAARRLAEAARLGFTRALVPPGGPVGPPGIVTVPVRSVAEALRAASGTGSGVGPGGRSTAGPPGGEIPAQRARVA